MVIRTRILNHGRSGGLYIAKVLRAVGLQFGHEEDRRDGASGALLLRPPAKRQRPYDQVFHQVRHPLLVIASATTCRASNYKLMFRFIGVNVHETNPVRRAMLSWLYYTAWANTQSSWCYRIESFPWQELCDRLRLPQTPLPCQIPVNTNHRDHANFSWDDLAKVDMELCEKIRLRALYYGYA